MAKTGKFQFDTGKFCRPMLAIRQKIEQGQAKKWRFTAKDIRRNTSIKSIG